MPILRSHGGDIAYRMPEWGTESNIPSAGAGYLSVSGQPVYAENVFGLPAAMQAIRQASVTVASLELAVFEGVGADKRPLPSSPQARLFADPSVEVSPFDWKSDLQSALEGYANAFALKIRDSRRRVVALDPVHPAFVQIRRKDGFKVFDIHYEGKTRTDLTTSDVFHVRGFCVGPGVAAPSPVWVHRNALGVATALQKFSGEFFRNNGLPPFWFTGASNATHAKEIKDAYSANRERALSGEPGALWGAIDVKSLPMSMEDAQFIETQQFSIEEIARIFNWPAWALDKTEGAETNTTVEQRTSNLLMFHLLGRLRRFEAALKSDPDLFGGTAAYPQFVTDGFVKVDARTQAEVEHKGVQSGTVLRDEVRAEHGRPPLPNGAGQVVPMTPVGATSQVASAQTEPED